METNPLETERDLLKHHDIEMSPQNIYQEMDFDQQIKFSIQQGVSMVDEEKGGGI